MRDIESREARLKQVWLQLFRSGKEKCVPEAIKDALTGNAQIIRRSNQDSSPLGDAIEQMPPDCSISDLPFDAPRSDILLLAPL
jgi:hypothetical protein